MNSELEAIDPRAESRLAAEKREAAAGETYNEPMGRPVERPDLPGASQRDAGMFASEATWPASYAKYRALEQRAVGSSSDTFVAPEPATIWFDWFRTRRCSCRPGRLSSLSPTRS